MHQDLLQLQTCLTFSRTKNTSPQDHDILRDHLDWWLGARWPKLPISLKYFWAIVFFLDRNDANNFGPKRRTLSKRSSYEKRCFKLEVNLWYASLLGADESWAKKKKLIVMLCTWKIWLNENQEKMLKNCKNTNHFFSYKELFVSLGNCVWNEKWSSFIIPSLIEKLSIITPFKPDNFSFNNPTKDHPLH